MSDLKEFTGRVQDEDWVPPWLSKVKSAFPRHQHSDEESFQIQYCGLGVSVAWQYYHARKRSDESSLGYLYRLNIAALRARLKIKDGDQRARREHVEHYIETLGDQELTLLQITDAEDL
ncbi:hypothetical protein PC116_g4540 [Phytophthora cactorum]|nr:hypothetical protein PC116_g4540 [Phytophthora cactorum]